jgi:hypothetical protein
MLAKYKGPLLVERNYGV